MGLLLKTILVIIRLKEVERRVGLKSSAIYQKISEGTFPTQVHLGARAVGWIESEIDAWIVAQVEKSRAVPVAAPLIPETTPGFAAAKQTPRNKVRTKQLFHPPKLKSPSSSTETNNPLLPPFALFPKGGRGNE